MPKFPILTDSESYILRNRINGHTFKELSDVLLCSKEKARQVYGRAKRKLNLAAKLVNDFEKARA